MTRRWVRCMAQGLVGVLLFAQMAIAAYACPGRSPAAAGTPQMATATVHTVQMANCDDMAGAMDAASATLCAEPCKYGQQSDQAPTLNVPVAVLTALYATPPVVEMAALPPRAAAASISALVAASPPHTVLHCVFRI